MALPDEVSAAYRRRTLALRARTYRDLLRIWPAFDPDDPGASAAWMAGARAVVQRDYDTASGLAVQYASVHALAAGAEVVPRVASAAPAEQVATSLRVTSLVAFRKAIGAGKSRGDALKIAYVRSSGAAARLVLNGGRSALINTAEANDSIRGWRRAGSPQCSWCKELIGRGTIYRSDSAADFAAHDHCSCGVENVYTGEARGIRDFEQSGRFRTQAQRDANNARIRAYLRGL